MVTPLRRGKLIDTSLSAFILIVFGVVPVGLLLARESRRFRDETLETAYVAVLILSWPFFCLAGILLLYFWQKDRSVDKRYFSTATTHQLSVISGALIAHATGCVLLFTGILLSTINRFQQQQSKFLVALDIVAMLLVAWIAYAVVSFIFDVRRSKRSLQEFDQNQAFEETPQRAEAYQMGIDHQIFREQQAVASEAGLPPTQRSERAYV